MTTETTDIIRTDSVAEFVGVLRDQHARKLDLVLSPDAIHYTDDGRLEVDLDIFSRYGTDAEGNMIEHPTNFACSRTFYATAGRQLEIPGAYLSRMVDAGMHKTVGANLEGWLNHNGKNVLLRTFTGDEPLARALLSPKFATTVDNLDVAFAALEGIHASGASAELVKASVTERSMYMRFRSPDVALLAPEFLRGYRDPWNGRYSGSTGDTPPVVHAGFDVRNSELGFGSADWIPVIEVLACKNGLVLPAKKFKKIHLGAAADQGVINWSDDVRQKEIEVIRAKAKEAVATFLSESFLREQMAEIEEKAGRELKAGPVKVVETLGKKLSFSKSEQDDILAAWVGGGQIGRAGGVLQAVTAAAHKAPSSDRAAELEALAWDAMDLAVGVPA